MTIIHHLAFTFMLTLLWPTQGCLTLTLTPLRWRVMFGRWGTRWWGFWKVTHNVFVGTTKIEVGPVTLHYLDNRPHVQAQRARMIGGEA